MSTETAPLSAVHVDAPVGPVAWAVFAGNGNIRIWSSASEPVQKLAEEQGVKLVPLYAIPDGWALVPIRPTEEMTAAGREASEKMDERVIYRAMLAAAPLSPNDQGNGRA